MLSTTIPSRPGRRPVLSPLAKTLFYIHFSTLVAMLTGCGGGSNSDSQVDAGDNGTATQEQGEVALYMTDAEGDFVSYVVDVESISLIKANGAQVETLPLNTRIDFAEYTDLTEFFTLQTLPAGVYTQVKLNLDYSDASIIVQDENGETHTASVVDTDGQTVTEYSVQVQLPDAEPLVIKKGVPAKLSMDFDLDASNTVLSYDPAVVEVEPILLATATLDTTREHRARGTLISVDTTLQTFSMALKPFRHSTGTFGNVSVQVNENTDYDINGVTSEGSGGLTTLSALAADTPIIVFGTVTDAHTFTASHVLAGSSIPWLGRDSARGVVIARDGDVLTLRGSHIERANGSITFYDNIQVNLGDATHVTGMAGGSGTLDKNDVSIGQRVIAFGSMSGETAGQFVMDATQGHVTMMMNLIKGEVISVNPLQIDLRWINGRRISLFDFTGTGSSTEENSDPNQYEIATSSMNLDTLAIGDWVKVRGYPAEFGSAPEDFAAQTLININTEQRAAAMNVHWQGMGSATPFLSVSDSSIVLNLADANQRVILAGIPLDGVDAAETSVTLDPLGDAGNGLYAIKMSGQPAIQLFKHFADYSQAMNTRITEGAHLKRITSLGRYDQTTDAMHAAVITSRFIP